MEEGPKSGLDFDPSPERLVPSLVGLEECSIVLCGQLLHERDSAGVTGDVNRVHGNLLPVGGRHVGQTLGGGIGPVAVRLTVREDENLLHGFRALVRNVECLHCGRAQTGPPGSIQVEHPCGSGTLIGGVRTLRHRIPNRVTFRESHDTELGL